MRLLLLLSALFTALAGAGGSARAAAVPAHQASASIVAVTKRTLPDMSVQRPPAEGWARAERREPIRALAVVATTPLYAGRLRV